jgi:hypothetical protein
MIYKQQIFIILAQKYQMSNNPLPDSRLDSVFDIIAGLRRQMLNTEDSAGQQRIWEVIKNYQNRIRAGEVFIPKF